VVVAVTVGELVALVGPFVWLPDVHAEMTNSNAVVMNNPMTLNIVFPPEIRIRRIQ